MGSRHERMREKWTEHTKALRPLKIGNCVRVQNQIGQNPLKWDKTGIIVEVKDHDQYVVKIDGSGRATLRNRKFLRRYEPVFPNQRLIVTTDKSLPQHAQTPPVHHNVCLQFIDHLNTHQIKVTGNPSLLKTTTISRLPSNLMTMIMISRHAKRYL